MAIKARVLRLLLIPARLSLRRVLARARPRLRLKKRRPVPLRLALLLQRLKPPQPPRHLRRQSPALADHHSISITSQLLHGAFS